MYNKISPLHPLFVMKKEKKSVKAVDAIKQYNYLKYACLFENIFYFCFLIKTNFGSNQNENMQLCNGLVTALQLQCFF